MKNYSILVAFSFIVISLFGFQFAFAKSLSLGLSESSAELSYNTGGDYDSSVDYGVTGFYNLVKVGDKDTPQTDVLVTVDIGTALEGESTSNFLFSLGGNAYGLRLEYLPTKTQDENKSTLSTGLMLGGKAGFLLNTTKPSLIYAEGLVSPNIVNVGKVETVTLFRMLYELQLSPATLLQVGYRYYHVQLARKTFHLGENSKKFENNLFAGIRLRF